MARCLYAALAGPLAALHAAGHIHGALSACNLRLVLVPEPYCDDAPVRLCGYRGGVFDAEHARRERSVLAQSICAIARHPDASVDATLRVGVEGDGAAPAGALLAASSGREELPGREQLCALWQAVARECPLIARVFALDR